jgi:tetratricopeptide (TPR) repeat protein
VADLQLLLQNPALRRPARTRILLVSRSVDGWLPALRNRLRKAGIAMERPMSLGPLTQTGTDHVELFTSAAKQFAYGLGLTGTPAIVNFDLSAVGEAPTVLTIHMAALVATHSYAIGKTTRLEPSALSAYLLDREFDYWQSLFDGGQIQTTASTMARVVYAATLAGARSRDVAAAILSYLDVGEGADVDAVGDHARCYPPKSDELVFQPLLPDRLGEDFIALLTPGHGSTAYAPDDWAREGLSRTLTIVDEGDRRIVPLWSPSSLAVLVETATRWDHVGRAIDPLIRQAPALAVLAGPAVLSGMASLKTFRRETIDALDGAMPRGRNVDLDDCAVDLAKRVFNERIVDATEGELANAYVELGQRLFNAAHYESALKAAEDAAAVYRTLSARGALSDPLLLPRSLGNLASILSALQMSGRAISVGAQCVEEFRRINAQSNNSYRHHVARGLVQHGTLLAHAKQWYDALVALDEAQLIYRELIESEGEYEYLDFELALALTNISAVLRNLGRPEDAVEASEEALRLRRLLVFIRPEEYAPGYAMALSQFGILLNEAHPSETKATALPAALEAVGMFRQLTRRSPDPATYKPHLVFALRNLKTILYALGGGRDALVVDEEIRTLDPADTYTAEHADDFMAVRGFAIMNTTQH